jgi:hypothetical protein
MLACWQQEHTYHLHVASFFNLIICVVETTPCDICISRQTGGLQFLQI